MRLTDLDPRFVFLDGMKIGKRDSIHDSNGIRFLCPKCFQANGGPRGTHLVICPSTQATPESWEAPARWGMVGTDFDDLTLTPSVHLQTHCAGCTCVEGQLCGWHGFVTNGEVTSC
jgi:hypothetical protein